MDKILIFKTLAGIQLWIPYIIFVNTYFIYLRRKIKEIASDNSLSEYLFLISHYPTCVGGYLS